MKQRLLFLGDIHGNFSVISQYIKKYELKNLHIIQVGDFGVGFQRLDKEKRMLEMLNPVLKKNEIHVWAIRGNHDYKPYFDNDPFGLSNIHLVADYEVLKLAGKNILCIGGAVSVDRTWRLTKKQRMGIFDNEVLGVESWWPNEVFQLDSCKLADMRNIDILLTHTAPHYCEPDNTFGFGYFVDDIVRQTGDDKLKTDLLFERQQVTEALEILKLNNTIELHIYGHFHKSWNSRLYDINHRLLNVDELWEENDYKSLS